MTKRAKSSLMLRVVTSLVLLPLVLALLWVPVLEWGFVAFVTLIAIVALSEFYRMSATMNPIFISGLVVGALIVGTAGHGVFEWMGAVFAFGLLVIGAVHLTRPEGSVAALSATTFGLIYVAWFASHILLLRTIDDIGTGLVMMLLVAVILTDTTAYFVGKFLGSHKMAPVVSPNKTWEGAAGGATGAILGMGAIYTLANQNDWTMFPDWSLRRYLLTGALLTVASQVGDLVESSLKRDAGVKDSGTIFPGHGGALDRCDGFLFAAPVLYYMALM